MENKKLEIQSYKYQERDLFDEITIFKYIYSFHISGQRICFQIEVDEILYILQTEMREPRQMLRKNLKYSGINNKSEFA